VAVVTVERTVDRPIETVWAVVTDVAAHRLPLTEVRTDPGEPGVGWAFEGITRLGPVGFADRMIVTRWHPPADGTACYAVVKTGRLLGGWAEVTLTEGEPTIPPGQSGQPGHRTGRRTRIRWREQITPHPHALGRLLAPATDRAVRAMFERAVTEMLARV